MASQRLTISKEDKDEFIREKMEKMKKKSEAILRRHAEVEADKRNADALSMQITKKPPTQTQAINVEKKVSNTTAKSRRSQQPAVIDEKAHLKEIEDRKKFQRLTKENGPPPDPVNFLADPYRDGTNANTNHPVARTNNRRHYTNYGGQDFQNVKHLMKEQRKYERQHPQTTNNNIMIQMTGKERKEYENWKAERLKIDEERIARQLTSSGSWKREWDLNKIEEDKEVQKTENVYYKQPRWLTETGNKEGLKGNRNTINPIVIDSSNSEVETKNIDRSVIVNENNSLTIVRSSEVKDPSSFYVKAHKDYQRNQDEKLQFERKSNFVDSEERFYLKQDTSWKQDNTKKPTFKITAKGDGWDTFQSSRNKSDRNWKQNDSGFNKDFSNTPEEWQRIFDQKSNESWEMSDNDKRKQADNWNSNSQEKFNGRRFKFKNNQEKFEDTQNNYYTEGTKGEFRDGEKRWNKMRKNSDSWTEEGWTKDIKVRNEGIQNKSKDSWTRKSSDGWEEYSNPSTEYKSKYSEKSRTENFRGNKKVYNTFTKSTESGWDGKEERYENSNQKRSFTGWENNLHKWEKSEGFDERRSGEHNWDFKKRGDRRFNNSNGKWFRENQNNRNNQRKNFSGLRSKGDFHKKQSENLSEIVDSWNIDNSKIFVNDGWDSCSITQSFVVNAENKTATNNDGWENQPANNRNKDLKIHSHWISNSSYDDSQNKVIPPESENHEDSWEDVTTSGGESLELSGPNEEVTSRIKDNISVESDTEHQLIKCSFTTNADNQLEKTLYAEEMNKKDIPNVNEQDDSNFDDLKEELSENRTEHQMNSEDSYEETLRTIQQNICSSTDEHDNLSSELQVQNDYEDILSTVLHCEKLKENSQNSFICSSDLTVTNLDNENSSDIDSTSIEKCTDYEVATLQYLQNEKTNDSIDQTQSLEIYLKENKLDDAKYDTCLMENELDDAKYDTCLMENELDDAKYDTCLKENELDNVSSEIEEKYNTTIENENSIMSVEKKIYKQFTEERKNDSLVKVCNFVEISEEKEQRVLNEFINDAKENTELQEYYEEHEGINECESGKKQNFEQELITRELDKNIELGITNSEDDCDSKDESKESKEVFSITCEAVNKSTEEFIDECKENAKSENVNCKENMILKENYSEISETHIEIDNKLENESVSVSDKILDEKLESEENSSLLKKNIINEVENEIRNDIIKEIYNETSKEKDEEGKNEECEEIKNETTNSQIFDKNSAILEDTDYEQQNENSVLGSSDQLLSVIDKEHNQLAVELSATDAQSKLEKSVLQEDIGIDILKVQSSGDSNQETQKLEEEESLSDQPKQRTVRKTLATESVTQFTEVLEVTASVPLRTAMQDVEKSLSNLTVDNNTNSNCNGNINMTE